MSKHVTYKATRRLFLLSLVWLSACSDSQRRSASAETLSRTAARVTADPSFAQLVERLSEPGGYFDTDNLISNETSYLHVVSKMREMGLDGGAYIGVGPDQNFSYMAQLRPSIAFIIDIRRDNLLQQLLFKSLFSLSQNRIEYLCLLLGRPFPDDAGGLEAASIQLLLDYIDATPPQAEFVEQVAAAMETVLVRFGVPLSQDDVGAIRRFHDTFIAEGLNLRFRSHGRQPRPHYPDLRRLLLETDLTGREVSYLANEDDFQFVKSLQGRDLIIPVVGDLSGDHALVAIGQVIAERGEVVSAFYTSNVEFYLWRDGSFDRFVDNVTRIPHDEMGVIIRSFFGGNFRYTHPQAVPGYYSTQLLQTIESLVTEYASGGIRTYFDLVNVGSLDLRPRAEVSSP